jgi:hypothetical protein
MEQMEVSMRKTITAALAALTFGGAMLASAAPAAADGWRGHGGWGRGDDDAGAAIVAGVAGLALGAALADNHPHYYERGYYDTPYYGRPYYERGYATCFDRREVWDPYLGRYIYERTPYSC